MLRWMIDALIILGSMLMIVNIIGFIKYAVFIKGRRKWNGGLKILYVPILLLCLFFIGYLSVWILGSPDIIMAGILFGGSVFVFIMLLLLNRITDAIIESERLEGKLLAAEESNRAKNAFLASISHEMRTPLNVILGLDELALKRDDLSEETRTSLVKIGQSGLHLQSLINNILDMQDLENGKQLRRDEMFYLKDVIDQINTMAGTLCEQKGLKYEPAAAENMQGELFGDDLFLKQILMNLLDNAVKFTQQGEVSFQVKQLREEDQTCVLEFTVKDTGIGISKEFLPKVFDLFAQEDDSFTNRFGGSGMGLAVTKKKMQLMKGTITAESEQGIGSAFTVTIPFAYPAKHDAASERSQTNAKEDEADAALEGRRILIVEDIDDNAEIVADILELERAQTERAENGSVALSMFEDSEINHYDAILMDLRMPIMDGIEATKKIRGLDRADAQTVPIIALTANAFEEDVKNSTDAGMNAHLVKPIDSDLLYHTLIRCIHANSSRKEAKACD